MPKFLDPIESDRLILRPIEINDADAYFEAEMASLNETYPYWSFIKPNKTIKEIKEFIVFSLECHKSENPQQLFFSILSKDSNKFLGLVYFQAINWFVPKFEISYWLDTRQTGNGYMTEAVYALSRACFTRFNAKRIEIKIFVDNEKSKRIPERLGFKQEAELENYFINFVTKKIVNGFIYSCCKLDSLKFDANQHI